MGRETWNLSKNGYVLGASSGSCNAALSTAEGSQLKKAGRTPWKQEVQPPDLPVGIVLSEATWPGTEGRGGVVFCA